MLKFQFPLRSDHKSHLFQINPHNVTLSHIRVQLLRTNDKGHQFHGPSHYTSKLYLRLFLLEQNVQRQLAHLHHHLVMVRTKQGEQIYRLVPERCSTERTATTTTIEVCWNESVLEALVEVQALKNPLGLMD
jgi:hypothetical protein